MPFYKARQALGPGCAVPEGLGPAVPLSAGPVGTPGGRDPAMMSYGLFEVKSMFSSLRFAWNREGCDAGVRSEGPRWL